MYTAVQGQGAYLNGRRIRVSGQRSLASALVATEIGSKRTEPALRTKIDNYYALARMPDAVHSIRSLGSAALNCCGVACGILDAYFEWGLHCWDICAGVCIVREAGGVARAPKSASFDLMAQRIMVASSPELAEAIAARIADIETDRD